MISTKRFSTWGQSSFHAKDDDLHRRPLEVKEEEEENRNLFFDGLIESWLCQNGQANERKMKDWEKVLLEKFG